MQNLTKTVLITGCSSGIGLACAKMLLSKGWTVFATARKQQDLEKLEAMGFISVPLELKIPESIRQAVRTTLERTGGALSALVNNSGYGQSGAVEDLSRSALGDQFEANVFGLVELTNHLIPVFRKQGHGRIVNVSSIAGRVALPFHGAYSASKFALEAITDALRIELKGSGIYVSLIEPGPIFSSFRKNALENFEQTVKMKNSLHEKIYEKKVSLNKAGRSENLHSRFMLSPEAAAKKIVRALESKKPKTRYLVTLPAYAGAFLKRFMPDSVMDWIMTPSAMKKIKD
ncbi:MAG: SDR family NAD(P)-dependent oxidoreductase [Candidatus Aureabacteria bacterium]|nr:SDR family NAD(P)-dependent oxidoreductase [Candidatus Auribacterota bacterium]